MPGIDYRQLRQRFTMDQVLELIGFQAVGQRGDQLRGPCPIPGCRSSSARIFSVHRGRQAYRCFACGARGNALDLWSAVRGLSLYQATLDLCAILHFDPPRLPPSPPSRATPPALHSATPIATTKLAPSRRKTGPRSNRE